MDEQKIENKEIEKIEAISDAEEIKATDTKIKLVALAIINFKKVMAILLTIAVSGFIIAMALSGWTCGSVVKTPTPLKSAQPK